MVAHSAQVTIVGAGLGGLTLARVLQRRGVPVAIYERERSASTRDQGGTLDMHAETGQEALRKAGLYDRFEELCSREADHMRILDKTGAVRFEDGGGGGGGGGGSDAGQGRGPEFDRPEVDRGALRKVLLDSLLPDTVAWGRACRSVEEVEEGRGGAAAGRTYALKFADGQTEVVNGLLVGADGAWSKVRPLVSEAKPAYSGVTFVELSLSQVEERRPEVAALIGSGSMFALGENKGLIAQRNSGDQARVYVTLRVPLDWHEHSGIAVGGADETRDRLCALFAGWSRSLLELIRQADDSRGIVPRPLFALPVDHAWPTRAGVTLLGDAAHLMTPFAGEGANLAMIDGAELGEAIASAWRRPDVTVDDDGDGDNAALTDAVSAFEARMFERASKAAKESASNLDVFVSDDAPDGAVERMNWLMSQAGPPSPQ